MDISYQQVDFRYQGIGTSPQLILNQLTLTIPKRQITAIVGKTGSGKTTLTKLLNGLEKPISGQVIVGDYTITVTSSEEDLFPLKKRVGMVFQFPESQLFEKSVLEDVMFGPLNFGFSRERARELAFAALESVGITSDYYNHSPLQLSGGQMRRVAIAGVLAYQPDVLVLDEPTAGLDSVAKREMMQLLQQLNKEGKTIIMVSHDMDEVAEYADYVAVMHNGNCVMMDTTPNIFYDARAELYGIVLPETVQIFANLMHHLPEQSQYRQLRPVTFTQLVNSIELMKQGGRHDE